MNIFNIPLVFIAVLLVGCGGEPSKNPMDNNSTLPESEKNPEPDKETAKEDQEPTLEETPDEPINTKHSKWEGPFEMPLVATAAANLPDGRILTWSAYSRLKFHYGDVGEGKTFTSIFDPATNEASIGLVSNTEHDMFCPGTALLPDGKVMVTGGTSNEQTSIYDPVTSEWTKGAKMKIPRAYHSMTPLSDGGIFTIGGSWGIEVKGNKNGEVWNESTAWVEKPRLKPKPLLTDDPKGPYRSDNHMWLYTAPNGLVFHAGPSHKMHWIDTVGEGEIRPSVNRGNDNHSMNGNAIMYDIGKILTVGGAPNYDDSDASSNAHIIDINGGIGHVTVKKVANMANRRAFHNSVVLPSGEVVVIGGQNHAIIFTDQTSVFAAEIWNPKTEKFTTLAEMKTPRNYHSVALLMKDGRIFVSGSGLCGKCTTNHLDAEIFTPPYLLKVDGTPAVRPVITESPSSARPGDDINVSVDKNGQHSFALVRLSSATHAVNNDERRIPLKAVKLSAGKFKLTIPANPAVVLPGNYFLFALNKNGVPSVAKILLINNK